MFVAHHYQVAYCGLVVLEAYYVVYCRNQWHCVFSSCCTVAVHSVINSAHCCFVFLLAPAMTACRHQAALPLMSPPSCWTCALCWMHVKAWTLRQ